MAKPKERDHAFLSASGAYRWLNCTPSAMLESKEPESTSVYADEGTLAHELGELEIKNSLKLVENAEYTERRSIIERSLLFNADMDRQVDKYVHFVLEEFSDSQAKTKDAILLLEERVSLERYIPEGFGRCDAIIIADGLMKVIDLKYGQGVWVDAKENPQLMLYGLGALDAFSLMYDISVVQLIIAQPRLDNWSVYEITAKDLKHWAEHFVKPKAELATKGAGIQYAGDWCKFCKVKAKCATLASQCLKVANHEFRDPHLLTDTQLIDVYKKQPMILDWIGAVAEFLLKEAINGKNWPGYKLVEGRSNRCYRDEYEAIDVLLTKGYTREEIFNIKLKGLTDLTKLLGKDKFNSLIDPLLIKPPGKPVLVENSDKRQALGGVDSAKNDFKID